MYYIVNRSSLRQYQTLDVEIFEVEAVGLKCQKLGSSCGLRVL